MVPAAPLALLAALLAQPASTAFMKAPGAPDNSVPKQRPGAAPRNCAEMCNGQRDRCMDSCQHAGHKTPDRMCKFGCERNQELCKSQCNSSVAGALSGNPRHAPVKPSNPTRPPASQAPLPSEAVKPPGK